MSARRVLVTGAGGFVGAHLARELVGRGDEVVGLGVLTAPVSTRALLVAELSADLGDREALEAALNEARPDAIVHLAALSSAGRSFDEPLETFRVNAIGTWNLLEAIARRAPRARVLVVGSGEVYGPQPAGTRVREDAPFRPVSPYALSKAAADRMAEIAATRGLDIVRTRSFGHTGPGQSPSFVVPGWAEQIAVIEAGRDEPILRVGNLDVVRDLSDVRDVAAAYAALLERGRAGAAYNVCRGEGIGLAEVARRLVTRARRPITIEVDPARLRQADVPYSVGDPSAIERDTGWRATTPLDQTLDDVLEACRAIDHARPNP